MREISPFRDKRQPAPSNTLDWNDPKTWLAAVPDIAPFITRELERHYLAAPPEHPYSDNLNWLEDRIYSVNRQAISIIDDVLPRLKSKFQSMRTCHSTRTENVERFYEEGILPLNPSNASERLQHLFALWGLPAFEPTMLESAIQDIGTELRAGLVWFDANEKSHYQDCGHYLLYGGEYLHSIALRLGHTDGRIRKHLRSVGTPTLYICDVPISLVSDYQLNEYVGEMLSHYFLNLEKRTDDLEELSSRGAAISIKQALQPVHIVGHYHPKRIRCPYEWRWHETNTK